MKMFELISHFCCWQQNPNFKNTKDVKLSEDQLRMFAKRILDHVFYKCEGIGNMDETLPWFDFLALKDLWL